ncbi:MAG: divergent polysaccharide deacetylase family protein [Negativicutes bacterium]|nr:divergent polysaccharide deacetylase family protein [Negativicutes bacterium]
MAGRPRGRNRRRFSTVWLVLLAVTLALIAAACFKASEQSDSGKGPATEHRDQASSPAVNNQGAPSAAGSQAGPSAGTGRDGSSQPAAGGGAAAKPSPGRPATTGGSGKIAVVIDDFGYDGSVIDGFAGLPAPVTFAVLPYKPYSQRAAQAAAAAGKPVMLHLPMQSLSGSDQESTTIGDGMSDSEIRQAVIRAIQAVPGVSGVNNHQGSAATANSRVMRAVMSVLRDRGLFFVDSRTSSDSVAYDVARGYGVPAGENAMFLDNTNDSGYVSGRLGKAAELAQKQGTIIVIGHARPATLRALREMIPRLQGEGIVFVPASAAVR